MTPAEILAILKEACSDVEWYVDGDGYKYQIEAIGEVFEGLNTVKRQQFVYQFLNSYIADGRIHAVTIQARTPTEQDNA